MRQNVADSIIQSVLTTKTDLRMVQIDPEELKEEVLQEPVEFISPKKKEFSETTITLPGGTIIRIAEEQPDMSKPGRKRKGDLVIKEVIESKRPVRNRKFPARFKKSPDKKSIASALKTARKRLNVDRVLIPNPKIEPKQIKLEQNLTNNNVEIKLEAVTLVSVSNGTERKINIQPTPSTKATSRRPSKDDRSSMSSRDGGLATVITVNPIMKNSNIQPQMALIHSNGTQVFAPSTIVLSNARKSQPSTPFLMNDILKGNSGGCMENITGQPVQVYCPVSTTTGTISAHQNLHRPPVIAPNNSRPSTTSPALHRKTIYEQSGSSRINHLPRGAPGRLEQQKQIIQPHRTYSIQHTPPDRRQTMANNSHSPIQRGQPQMRQPQTIILPQIPVNIT